MIAEPADQIRNRRRRGRSGAASACGQSVGSGRSGRRGDGDDSVDLPVRLGEPLPSGLSRLVMIMLRCP
ncbi:hypothetical protein [Streptomyces xanthochromogenes]|uniref:hypothetical protein n=1 Tax=Streptomyces xanthochromogenes TaxID=67384 RepID=UPI00343131F1